MNTLSKEQGNQMLTFNEWSVLNLMQVSDENK